MAQQALLLVDVQMCMFGDPAVERADRVLQQIIGLQTKARAAGVPVIYIQDCGEAGQPTEPGQPGWMLHPALVPQAGEVIIEKSEGDAFVKTPLDTLLRGMGVGGVIVAGMQSEACVHDTCRGAHALGYTVTLVEDAHSTYPDGKVSAASLVATVNRAIGDVMRVRPAAALRWSD